MSTEAPAFELHQTRAFNRTERNDLMQIWRKTMWPNGGGTLYNMSYYLWYGFGSFLVVSIWMAVDRLLPFEPELSLQLAIAAIGFALAVALSRWISTRMQHDVYWDGMTVDDRYVIDQSGVRRVGGSGETAYGWRGIQRLVNVDPYVVLLCGGQEMLLAKAAFADQDVDGFCRELERRWHEARAQSA